MPDTDGPLKRLVETSATNFAEWLLGAEVREIQAVNVERPADAVRIDQLYRVTLASGKQTLFHIEFQGRSSHRPVKWRMLEYMARLADAELELGLYSVVLYVGRGAGANEPVSIRWMHRTVLPA